MFTTNTVSSFFCIFTRRCRHRLAQAVHTPHNRSDSPQPYAKKKEKKKTCSSDRRHKEKRRKKKHKNILMTTYNWQFKPQHFTRQAGTELCSENNRPGPDMSDGVERTKRVRGENNASIHQVQLHGRDIKLRQRDELSGSGSGIVSVFLFFLLKFFFDFFFPPSLGRDSPLPITMISDEDMRKIKESKK